MLTNVIELVDKSIFEAIYQVALAEGYTPNRDTYLNNKAGYDTALATIRASKGFAVEVFGASTSQDKENLHVPRIVYLSQRMLPGDLGGSPDKVFKLNNQNKFDASVLPPSTSKYQFGIKIVANSSKQDRVMHAIVAQRVSNRRYIKYYNDSTQSFLIIQYSYRENPDTRQGISEKYYFYEAVDLFESENTLVQENISPINEINTTITNNNIQDNDNLTIIPE